MIKRKLTENIRRVEERIQRACARVGRSPAEIRLVAVTKTVGLDVIRTLLEMGTEDLGESRVQELVRRASMITEWQRRRGFEPASTPPALPRWHLVGHLQRNKVKLVLPFTHLIHSLDSLRLAEEIDAQSRKLDRVTPVLLQVNAANEPQKSGVAVAAATHLADQLRTLPNLRLCGLMAMAPLTDDEKRIRHTFGRARELFDEMVHERIGGPHFRELSLGMSQDFEYGIEVGATLIRVGSALFEGIEQTIEPAAAESA
ncbi:MAG TPA: YggS family pyridoxal phosphate-dependent enzyme [Phycisphaerae bacterium]|nr:YggS family pyridoxal phosphate-dependent enzyme [Phycisphaerae bacterium]HNU43713.1 YggS family pyridoxal phosphate-dependent enzyme [Phycisphaerae bacterium]